LIPRLVDRIAAREPITLFNPSENPRINPLYIDDACELTRRALEYEKPLTVNAAGPGNVSIKEICRALAHQLGRGPIFVRRRDPAIGNMLGDMSLAEQVLDFKPKIGFQNGLLLTLAAKRK
jgi:nucleoside-diphosphate-sugar epimerase